jgi:hypothetical protein
LGEDLDQHLSLFKGLIDQDQARALDASNQQVFEYRERIRLMVEGEIQLRDALETSVKELEICKEHYKGKVKECDALDEMIGEYERGKVDLES